MSTVTVSNHSPVHESKFVSFYTSTWPAVQVTFGPAPTDQKEFEQYLSWLRELYSAQQRFRIMFDGSSVGFGSLKYIDQQVKFMKENEDNTIKLMEKAAIVVNSPMAKQIVNIVFKLKPPATPIRVFDNIQQAWTWLISDSLEGAIVPKIMLTKT